MVKPSEASVSSHRYGWTGAFDKLVRLLGELPARANPNIEEA